MRLNLPKPLHGWRAFFGEVGIIVLGVLLALAAQQVVEMVQWHQTVLNSETAMSEELSEDDGAQAEARVELSPCFASELEKLERALVDQRDGGGAFVSPGMTAPPFRTWDNEAWTAAVSSDATSHMSTAQMSRWSAAYVFIPEMNEATRRESSDWADLDRIRLLRRRPSETEREAMLTAIGRARHDNDLLTTISKYFLHWSRQAGVSVPHSATQQELSKQRKEMSRC
jgi:hypothetical protein